MLEAEITGSGDVMVEGQHVGQLQGFRFTADPQAAGEVARTLNAAAQKALASEIEGRAQRVNDAVDDAFVLANDGTIRWLGEPVGKLTAGEHILEPRVRLLADDQLTGAALEMVQRRLDLWVGQHIKKLLGSLSDLEKGEGIEGIGRGIAFQIGEALGVLERSKVAQDTKTLDQAGRAALRKLGVRFGAYHLYLPQLLKPAPRALAAQLWALKHGGIDGVKGLDEVAHLASSGRTSFASDKDVPKGLYLAAGFRVCGERAVRVDILERLADLVRPAIAYRPGVTPGEPPAGTADGDAFIVTVAMTSLAGCSGEAFASILKSLGYVSEQRPGPAITVPLLQAAPTEPIRPASAPAASEEPVEADAEAATQEASEASAETPADAAVETEAPVAEAPAAVEAEAIVETPMEAAPAEPEGVPETEAVAETEASAEAPAEAASEDAAAPAEPAEPVQIEVWRPGRRPQEGRGPRRDNNQRNRGPRRDGAPGQNRRPFPAAAGAPAPAGEGAPAAEGTTAPAEGQRPPRRDNRRFEGFKRGDRPQGDRPQGDRPQGDRPRGDRPQGDRNDRGNRGPRPDRPRNDRPFASSEQRAPRERQPDPNSPFAKLLALKAELENKGKKD